MGLLAGGDRLSREAIYWHYPHYGNQGGTPGSSVRAERFKLIEFYEDPRLELYDLETDLSEDHNLAADQPKLARELHAMLAAWREEVRAVIPQPNPRWLVS
jgi:arylsulfatase A-like enzyme